jgi:hypothetical protein
MQQVCNALKLEAAVVQAYRPATRVNPLILSVTWNRCRPRAGQPEEALLLNALPCYTGAHCQPIFLRVAAAMRAGHPSGGASSSWPVPVGHLQATARTCPRSHGGLSSTQDMSEAPRSGLHCCSWHVTVPPLRAKLGTASCMLVQQAFWRSQGLNPHSTNGTRGTVLLHVKYRPTTTTTATTAGLPVHCCQRDHMSHAAGPAASTWMQHAVHIRHRRSRAVLCRARVRPKRAAHNTLNLHHSPCRGPLQRKHTYSDGQRAQHAAFNAAATAR